MDNTLIVNLFGGPGSGKSTMAAGLYYQLKVKGYECEMAREYAKELLYSKDHSIFTMYNHSVTVEQNRRIRSLIGQVDIVICDSPILLGIIYDREGDRTFTDYLIDKHNEYWNYNVFLERKLDEYNQKGRFENQHEAVEVDKKITSLLKLYGIESTYYTQSQIKELTDEVISTFKEGPLDKSQ